MLRNENERLQNEEERVNGQRVQFPPEIYTNNVVRSPSNVFVSQPIPKHTGSYISYENPPVAPHGGSYVTYAAPGGSYVSQHPAGSVVYQHGPPTPVVYRNSGLR